MPNVKKEVSIDLMIIDALKNYTSNKKTLTTKSIADKINEKKELKVDKKTVKRHLDKLSKIDNAEYGTIKSKALANGGKIGWYIDNFFSDTEILTTVLSLYAAKNLNLNQTNHLINKLSRLSNGELITKYGLDNKNNIVQFKTTENKNFYNIMETIIYAIENKKVLKFEYQKYDINCKLKKIVDENNKIKSYKVLPYKLIVYNGRYYLHCRYIDENDIEKEDLRNFRVDRMDKLSTIEKQANIDVKKLSINDVNEYTAKHVFMYGDEPISCTIKIKKDDISEFIDWFGNYYTKKEETKEYFIIKLNVCYSGMKIWVMQHLDTVELLEPKNLRDDIKSSLKSALNKYK